VLPCTFLPSLLYIYIFFLVLTLYLSIYSFRHAQVTDTPQIISRSKLAMFDPCHHAFLEGGNDFDVAKFSGEYEDQLSPFDMFLPRLEPGSSSSSLAVPGTVIRLPFRTKPSTLNNNPVTPTEIKNLLLQFISGGEMEITLLFLSHVSCIEIREVDEEGAGYTVLARAEVVKEDEHVSSGANRDVSVRSRKVRVKVSVKPGIEYAGTAAAGKIEVEVEKERSWRILRASFDEQKSVQELKRRFDGDPSAVLDKNKLVPDVGLAIPLGGTRVSRSRDSQLGDVADSEAGAGAGREETGIVGRLFTFLPLPIQTDFPCHVHALFALKQDRQGLKFGDKGDLMAGADDWWVFLIFVVSFSLSFSLLFVLSPFVLCTELS
jgi:hypothetical protein